MAGVAPGDREVKGMHVNRGLLGWGVFFIIAGAVPLGVRAGLVDVDTVREAWQLWPLILVGIGIGLVLQRTQAAVIGGLVVAVTCGLMAGGALAGGFGPTAGFTTCGFGGDRSGTAFAGQGGTLGTDARVTLVLNCGELTAGTASGSAWSLAGTSNDGQPPSIVSDASRLEIRAPEHRGFDAVRGGHWQLTLPQDPTTHLSLSVNAGSARVDLGAAHAADIDVSVNAGDAHVGMATAVDTGSVNASVNAGSLVISLPPPSGTLRGSFSVNAGSMELCVPDGVGLRIRVADNVLASHNFGDRGLTHSGDVWTRPGFDTSTQRIDLTASANLGSITLNPESGCD